MEEDRQNITENTAHFHRYHGAYDYRLSMGQSSHYAADGEPCRIRRLSDKEKMDTYRRYAAIVAQLCNFFLSHYGIDFGAVEKAIEYNKKHKKTRGASTVSQQTAKNVFLWQGRTWVRKGFEVYFTFLIETFWSKEHIMEVYLNVIEMGRGVYGIEAAARNHFGKEAAKLTPYQSALIVASFPNPLRYNPAKPSEYLTRRANAILALSQKMPKVKFDDKTIEKAKKRHEKHIKNKKR